MELIDGKKTAEQLLALMGEQVAEIKKQGIIPGLAVILVGQDAASKVYVNSKVKTCEKLGMYSKLILLESSVSQAELLRVVESLNVDKQIHGILIQSPLSSHISEEEIVKSIDPSKDVDGFHPENVGKLVLDDESAYVPCTPAGCLALLKAYQIETQGAEIVVVGRSHIVGKPMALILMGSSANATVTVVHSRTRELKKVCQRADILIVAIGKPEFITEDFVKEGAVVIDVGINRVDDREAKRGYRLVGDVLFNKVAPKCRAITPVPGGVGPMTICLLMKNTLRAAQITLSKN